MINSLNLVDAINAASTVVIALFTLFLWLENRKLRRAGSEPRIVAHFEIHPSGNGAVNLALSNIGTGPALDVSFQILLDASVYDERHLLVRRVEHRAPLTLISQGEKVSFGFGVGPDLFKGGRALPPFEVLVKWRPALCGNQFESRCTLDISQFAGLPGLVEKPPVYKISDQLGSVSQSLEQIANHMAK